MVTQATLYAQIVLRRLRLRQKEREKKERSEEKWSNVSQLYTGRGVERG
jgi:hypothetical protein